MSDGIRDSIQTGYSPGEETYVDKRKRYEDQNEIDPDDIPSNKYKPVKTYDDIMKTVEDFAIGRGGPWKPITEPTKLLITQLMETLTFTHKQHTELLKEKSKRPRPAKDIIGRERIREFLMEYEGYIIRSMSVPSISEFSRMLREAHSIICLLNIGYHVESFIRNIITEELDAINDKLQNDKVYMDVKERETKIAHQEALTWVLRRIDKMQFGDSISDNFKIPDPIINAIHKEIESCNSVIESARPGSDESELPSVKKDTLEWVLRLFRLFRKQSKTDILQQPVSPFVEEVTRNKEEEMDAVQELASREEPDEQTRSWFNEGGRYG